MFHLLVFYDRGRAANGTDIHLEEFRYVHIRVWIFNIIYRIRI